MNDNYVMTMSPAKKLNRKKPARATRTGKRHPSDSKARLVQKDREERKKISKTLDLAAFMADFARDTTSAAYWETKE